MADIAITRFRGDTVADQFTVKDAAGVVVNITGFSFIMTVNTLKAPPDVSTQLFSVAGVITNPTGGVVEFRPTVANASQLPGKYYFDIQMTDAGGKIQTLCVGSYTFKQDITKV